MDIVTPDISHAEILKRFPLEKPRDGQVEAIHYILDNFLNKDKKFVFLEAPTGAGKSVIGVTVSRFFETSYYLTIQKFLQDQLVADFGEDGRHGEYMVDLKGRNAYECTYYKLNADKLLRSKLITPTIAGRYKNVYHSCSEGHCREHGKNKYDECVCPYFVKVDKAIAAPMCLMNFSSFLYQTAYTDRFGSRDLIILDEAHNIETQLMGFISVTISNSDFKELTLPKLDTPEQYAEWMEDNGVSAILQRKIEKAERDKDFRRVDELQNLRQKLDNFINYMKNPNHSEWVAEYHEVGDIKKIVCKPVFIMEQAHQHLFSMGKKVLMLSATILNANVMSRALGINKEEMAAKRLGSTFPVENRPIMFKPVAKFTGGKEGQRKWGPKLVKAVDIIAKKFAGQRGIVHTHNFSIARMLLNDCDAEVRPRMLFQESFRDKQEMLEHHSSCEDSIIVAPAMHEGLDLKGNLSRFQIICKLPFPNFYEDKQLAIRKDLDPQFYDWLVSLKLVQSVGRSIRSETDWANTYIIDSSFEWWYRRNKNNLPEWFREAVKGI